jgi:hypothetical protein
MDSGEMAFRDARRAAAAEEYFAECTSLGRRK